jgi:hypothetical protein
MAHSVSKRPDGRLLYRIRAWLASNIKSGCGERCAHECPNLLALQVRTVFEFRNQRAARGQP